MVFSLDAIKILFESVLRFCERNQICRYIGELTMFNLNSYMYVNVDWEL